MNLSRWLLKPGNSSKVPSFQQQPLPAQEHTFSDGDYHEKVRQERLGSGRYSDHADAGGDGSNGKANQRRSHYENNTFGAAKKPRKPRSRWSYMLQDIPENIAATLNDINKGYMMRVAAVVGVTLGVGAVLYYGILVPRQERKPLAQRWSLFARRVPVTLVEKNREEGSAMYTYRFALPNSFDYAGYDPVSSVRLYSGRVRELSSLNRWYTPISPPDTRGFIEFAIKDCDPGRMSSRLRYLEPGDVVYLGRWMKEFDYSAVKKEGGEMGLVCTTAGASVALQLMRVMEQEEEQRKRLHPASSSPAGAAKDAANAGPRPTRLQLLFCHQSARAIPFKKDFFDKFEKAMPERIAVKYNVLSMSTRSGPGAGPVDPSLVVGENCFVGHLDPEILQAALPPPVRAAAEEGTAPSATHWVRPHILVCGPQSMMTYLCGRVSPIGNLTYWKGWWFRYTGLMKDMGYERSQVYKFGVSTHFLAIH